GGSISAGTPLAYELSHGRVSYGVPDMLPSCPEWRRLSVARREQVRVEICCQAGIDRERNTVDRGDRCGQADAGDQPGGIRALQIGCRDALVPGLETTTGQELVHAQLCGAVQDAAGGRGRDESVAEAEDERCGGSFEHESVAGEEDRVIRAAPARFTEGGHVHRV